MALLHLRHLPLRPCFCRSDASCSRTPSVTPSREIHASSSTPIPQNSWPKSSRWHSRSVLLDLPSSPCPGHRLRRGSHHPFTAWQTALSKGQSKRSRPGSSLWDPHTALAIHLVLFFLYLADRPAQLEASRLTFQSFAALATHPVAASLLLWYPLHPERPTTFTASAVLIAATKIDLLSLFRGAN